VVQSTPGYGLGGDLVVLPLFADYQANLRTVTSFWRNVTDAMTAVIHAEGIRNVSNYTYGTAYVSDTCARVEWAWLALPSFVVPGVVVFLTVLIVTSPSRSERPLWKSSALALLRTELGLRHGSGVGALPTKTGLDMAAARRGVRPE
jgi:hypothetical protein